MKNGARKTMIRRGEYKIIRVDGTERLIESRPTIHAIHQAIGATCLDTVILQKDKHGQQAAVVMMVDDTGMIDGKPVNEKATALYHAVRKTRDCIHGDVAIVHDEDFA